MVLVDINGHHVEMEVDTGAATLLIRHTEFDNLWNEPDKSKHIIEAINLH